jgi:hypothetical protein
LRTPPFRHRFRAISHPSYSLLSFYTYYDFQRRCASNLTQANPFRLCSLLWLKGSILVATMVIGDLPCRYCPLAVFATALCTRSNSALRLAEHKHESCCTERYGVVRQRERGPTAGPVSDKVSYTRASRLDVLTYAKKRKPTHPRNNKKFCSVPSRYQATWTNLLFYTTS